MSEAQVINMMLNRKLESGSQYSGLIPNYLSVKHSFELPDEFSDTYDTLEYMAYWTDKYAAQFQKVANKLKGKNVLETVKNNYNFLYKHFQYKIDESLQQLYAPSAAWHFRKVGFDCKTFSVLASALLLCQNIEHSFVKVKLQGSNDWGHVYVQIPYQGSYLIIDATTHDNKEVNFIEKHEFNMRNLKHIGLASPYLDMPYLNLDAPSLACPGQACSCNSNIGLANPLNNDPYTMMIPVSSENGLNGFSYDDVKTFFTGLDCIGGSAYTDGIFRNNVNIANQLFEKIVQDINSSVVNNPNEIGRFVAEFKGMANLLRNAYEARRKQKDWNSCSDSNFRATVKVFDFFAINVSAMLDQWLTTYFIKKELLQRVVYNNDAYINLELGFWGTGSGGLTIASSSQDVFVYEPKETTIKAFELNQYIVDATKNNNFQIDSYLQTLQTVLKYFDTPVDTFPVDDNGNPIETGNGNSNTELPKSKVYKMNGGTIAFAGLLLASGIWGFSKIKDNGPGAKQNQSKKN